VRGLDPVDDGCGHVGVDRLIECFELDGVVDLVDDRPRGGLHQVDAQQPAADGSRCRAGELRYGLRDRVRGRLRTHGGVGDPVVPAAGHRRDGLTVGDDDPQVTVGLVDVLLQVEHLVLVVSEHGLVLQDRLCGIP